ncbi:uncharacterized protein LOC100198293 isoform X2 [Hydra vulgaris]|uniref:uncharacterized protein LOC100198293 isoform X2 n=1 Tax=Hydra vulgaris TaxID=6087 RepID=UPI001F5F1422|nr:uncharacterized protein LOC100198293 isoform X2 [Hydra vulgaris]
MSIAETTLELTFQKDQDNFIGKLQEFHALRGNAFERIPTFGGQSLDLYALYNTVISFGGIDEVTKKGKWEQVFKTLGYPPCTNADFALKQHYSRFLEAYEKIFFLGEDVDDRLFPDKYKWQNSRSKVFKHSKPGVLGEFRSHNFDRIMLSLLSGLENEVDFALNICTLLSNVSNSIFNLGKNCSILDLILAHSGFWCTDNSFDKEMCTEWFSRSGKNFLKFWNDSISDPFLKKVYNELYNTEQDKVYDEHSFFSCGTSQEKSSEFARVLQISMILYNFSFEQINAMFLAQHSTAEKFLLFSSFSSYNNIQNNSLDTLDNISEYITLKANEDFFTQQILRIIHLFCTSKDRFRRIRAKSILAKLARSENAKIIAENLSQEIYKILLDTISFPDISLVLASMDALFSLSGLCENTATSICLVQGSMNLLTSLLTLQAESFGNHAIEGFRIVENKCSMFTPKNQAFLQSQYERSYIENNRACQPGMIAPPSKMHTPHLGNMHLPMPRLPPYHVLSQPTHHVLSQPTQIYPNLQPIQTYPNQQPIQTYPNQQPINTYPNQQPIQAYPNQQPIQTYPNQQPTQAYPNQQPIQAYPNQQSIQAYPNLQLSKADASNVSYGNQTNEFVEVDSETYAVHWMSAYYEPHPSNNILLSTIYADYEQVSKSSSRKGILSFEAFQVILRAILPPHLAQIILIDSNGTLAVSGIQRKAIPLYVQSVIPAKKCGEEVKISNDISQNETFNKLPNTHESENVSSQLNGNSEKPVSCDRRLKTGEGYYEVIEKLKIESEGHFMQFHLHRQHLQALQVQIHQLMQTADVEHVPATVIKDIQIRAQNHQQQMQNHYQKLLQLTNLTEQVHSKMIQQDDVPKGSIKTNDSFKTPDKEVTQESFLFERNGKLENEFNNSSNHLLTDQKSLNKFSSIKPDQVTSTNPHTLIPHLPFKNESTVQPPIVSGDLIRKKLSPSSSPLSSPKKTKSKRGFNNPLDYPGFPQISQNNRLARTSPQKKVSLLTNGISLNGATHPVTPVPAVHSSTPVVQPFSTKFLNISSQEKNHLPFQNNTESLVNFQTSSSIMNHFSKTFTESKLNGVDVNYQTNCFNSKFKKQLDNNSVETPNPVCSIPNSTSAPSFSPLIKVNHLNGHQINGNFERKIEIQKENIKSSLSEESINDDFVDFERICDSDHISSEAVLQKQKKTLNEKEINNIESPKGNYLIENSHEKTVNSENHNDEKVDQLQNCLKPDHKELNFLNSKLMLGKMASQIKPNGIETKNNSFKDVTVNDFESPVTVINREDSRVNCLRLPLGNSNFIRTSDLHTNNRTPKISPQTSIISNDFVQKSDNERNHINLCNLTTLQTCRNMFKCKWNDCYFAFHCESELFEHMVMNHAPTDGKMQHCNVAGCFSSQMLRGSFILHLQDVHFSSNTFLNYWKVEHENESPVTRSLRFTAALILRNIAKNSPCAKSLLLRHEDLIARVAMSTSEAASAAAECLFELYNNAKTETSDTEDLDYL